MDVKDCFWCSDLWERDPGLVFRRKSTNCFVLKGQHCSQPSCQRGTESVGQANGRVRSSETRKCRQQLPTQPLCHGQGRRVSPFICVVWHWPLHTLLWNTSNCSMCLLLIMGLFHHREALLSRPDELAYGVIKIQATKVKCHLSSLQCFLKELICWPYLCKDSWNLSIHLSIIKYNWLLFYKAGSMVA